MKLNTYIALLIRLVITFVVALIAFTAIDGNGAGLAFLIALAAAAVNYYFGDRMALPKHGNTTASVGNGIMAAAAAFLLSLVFPALTVSAAALIIFAILIAIADYFFHPILHRFKGVVSGEPGQGQQ